MKDFKPNYKSYNERTRGGVVHSKHYHKYFEGYAEVQVEKPNGKKKIERIYMDDYYKQKLSDQQWIILKMSYVFLFLLGVTTFIFGASLDVKSNLTWYVSFPSFCSTFSLFLLFLFLVPYVSSPRLMTNWEYITSSGRVKRFSRIAIYCLALQIFAIVVFLIVNSKDIEPQEFLSMLCYIFAGAAMFAINWIEKHVSYTMVENTNKLPEDGFIIR